MRSRTLILLALAGSLLAAPIPNQICKNRCESDYQLCLKRSANKEGRKTCKVFRKSCTRGCPPK